MDHPVSAFLSQAFILVTAGDNFGVYPLCRYGPGRDLSSAPPLQWASRGGGGRERHTHDTTDRSEAAGIAAPSPSPPARAPLRGAPPAILLPCPRLPRPRLGTDRSVWFGSAPSPARPGLPGAGLSWVMRSWRRAPGVVIGSGGALVQEGARGRKCRPQFFINPDTSKVNKARQGRASREGREEASDRRLSRAEPGLFPARQ